MHESMGTQVSRMQIRRRKTEPEPPQPAIQWKAAVQKHPGERLLSNMAVAAALCICAVVLRTGALPPLSPAADAVLTAATDHTLLDESLGRLSFVSSLFPEAALVFGGMDDTLALPVSGGAVVHAWSQAEPWMSWQAATRTIRSAGAGEVIGVYHGNGDERLVQVMGEDGIACLYGNLEEVCVSMGDAVAAGDVIGNLLPGADAVFEVRRSGVSIDPALLLGGV